MCCKEVEKYFYVKGNLNLSATMSTTCSLYWVYFSLHRIEILLKSKINNSSCALNLDKFFHSKMPNIRIARWTTSSTAAETEADWSQNGAASPRNEASKVFFSSSWILEGTNSKREVTPVKFPSSRFESAGSFHVLVRSCRRSWCACNSSCCKDFISKADWRSLKADKSEVSSFGTFGACSAFSSFSKHVRMYAATSSGKRISHLWPLPKARMRQAPCWSSRRDISFPMVMAATWRNSEKLGEMDGWICT